MNSNKAIKERKKMNANKVFQMLRGFGAILVLVTFVACGGGVTPPVTAIIGPGGGTVTGPGGAQVVIPEGALSQDVEIGIAQTSDGAPALPSGTTSLGAMFAFTPHGTTFAVPITMTVPFNAGAVPAGSTPTLFKTNAAQSAFEAVAGATVNGSSMTAQVTSFSFANVGNPVESVGGLSRSFIFNQLSRNGPGIITEGLLTGSQEKATDGALEVFATVDGKTYWAATGPTGGNDIPTGNNGLAFVFLSQSFVKRAPDAKARLILSDINIEAADFNPNFSASELSYSGCSKLTADMPEVTKAATCSLLDAHVQFAATAFEGLGPVRQNTFLDVSGLASLEGFLNNWSFTLQENGRTPLWAIGRPVGEGLETFEPKVTLPSDLVIDIDLSSVAVCPPELEVKDCQDRVFTIQSSVLAFANNLRGRESGIRAMIRDPLSISGSALTVEGLESTDTPASAAPVGVEAPVPCTAPNPAAGVLQFSSPTYEIAEGAFRTSDILVTRTGGSEGAVSVTFRASDGTAVTDVDYTAPAVTVHFADGDTTARSVELTALADAETEPDKTVNLLLSEPGGCATLGAQASAVVTLLDDDDLPPPSSDTFLDPTFGTEGKAFAEQFGGSKSAMALQPDGKVVMVGGFCCDFILARFNADGSLDDSFDGDGKVTTDLAGGFNGDQAQGVAIQSDGKIVVVGFTRVFSANPEFNFALARYDTNGSLDTSFDGDGIVTSGVAGEASAVAIQPNGNIVVAGRVDGDFALARYSANGTLEFSVTTDFGGVFNEAQNIVLQPDGAIVVSGKPIGDSDYTDIARYDADGNLDSSFGSAGKLTLVGQTVGAGLALQPDGKLVLVGSTLPTGPTAATIDFALTRLNSDGSPDTTFQGGTVTTDFGGQRTSANAVAVQADGKIVVVGSEGDFAVARYDTDGKLDTSFADGGKLEIDFFRFPDIAESVAIQPDGKIVVGGFAEELSSGGYGVIRIVP